MPLPPSPPGPVKISHKKCPPKVGHIDFMPFVGICLIIITEWPNFYGFGEETVKLMILSYARGPK